MVPMRDTGQSLVKLSTRICKDTGSCGRTISALRQPGLPRPWSVSVQGEKQGNRRLAFGSPVGGGLGISPDRFGTDPAYPILCSTREEQALQIAAEIGGGPIAIERFCYLANTLT